MPRTIGRQAGCLLAAIVVLVAFVCTAGPAAAQMTKPGEGGITTYDAPTTEKKEAPRPADLAVPLPQRSVEAMAEDKREAQIITLLELIEMKDDSDPEKPELLMRQADLNWEKAEAFEAKGNDLALEKRIFEAEESGNVAVAERLKRERDDYFDKQKQWQEKAVSIYKRIEENFPTYEALDEVLYYLAFNLGLMERGDEALQYYVRLASDFPQSKFLPDALFNVGEYYFETNEFPSALVFYEKVANFPEALVFGYAVYKQGWCYYNMGDYDKAFESFLAVVRYTDEMEAKGKKLPVELKREAQRDLVTTYSQVGTPDKALAFFKTVSPTEYLGLGAQLAELYTDQGKFDESSRLLQTIIAEDPGSYRVITYQRIIVMNAEKRGVKEVTAKEAERLIGLYKKVAPTAPDKFVAEEQAKLDQLLRVMSTTYHQEHEKTGEETSLALARRLYGVYVELFPESQDSYEMHRNYAVLLYQQKEWEKAASEYEIVIAMKPEGSFTPDAAYAALLCYFRLVELGDTAEKGDDATDLDPRELPELNAKMVKAADRFVSMVRLQAAPDPEVTDLIPDAKFAAAKMLYDANRFDEALPRFRDLITTHEHHRVAPDAARLLLSSYHLKRDMRNLNRWATILAGKPHLATGGLADIIRRIRDQAEYNQCFEYEGDKLYKRAADCFVEYTKKFPTSELMDKALYYAAINYDKAHMMERAIETFVDLYNRQSRSPLAPKALFAVGKVYHHAAVYSEASRYYEIYAEKHPKDEYVEEALRFASIFRKSLGDYEQAVANLELYLRRFPKSERAPNVFFDIGLIYERQRDWKKMIDHFESYLKKYGKSGPLDLSLTARLKLAQAYGKYKSDRQQRRSQEYYRDLITYFNGLAKEKIEKEVTPAGVSAVAEARFLEGEALLERALAVKITERNIETATAEKLQLIAQANEVFQDVYSFEHPHWQIASLNRGGVALADLADAVENAPCPRELTEEQCEIQKQDLAIRADQIRQSAIELFRKALETAREQQWFNRFSEDAEQRLAQIDYTFRFTKEYRAKPIHKSTRAFPPSFRFAEKETQTQVPKMEESAKP
jgi:tetratricopeptide (TPR) repeat protein